MIERLHTFVCSFYSRFIMKLSGTIGAGNAESSVTETNGNDAGRHEHRDDRLPKGSPSERRGIVSQKPHYLDFEGARQLLAEMNVHLTRRQIKRSSDKDVEGKRKLPWFIDPIEGRLKIERNALLSAYFNRQVEAERNCDL